MKELILIEMGSQLYVHKWSNSTDMFDNVQEIGQGRI